MVKFWVSGITAKTFLLVFQMTVQKININPLLTILVLMEQKLNIYNNECFRGRKNQI